MRAVRGAAQQRRPRQRVRGVAHGVDHAPARHAVVRGGVEQRAPGHRAQQRVGAAGVDHVDRDHRRRVRCGEAAAKDADRGQRAALVGFERADRAREQRAQRGALALAARRVARERAQQRARGRRREPPDGELDRERRASQAAQQRRDVGVVRVGHDAGRFGAVGEQGARGRRVERLQAHDALVVRAKRHAAGREHAQRRRGQRREHLAAGLGDALAAVEHDERRRRGGRQRAHDVVGVRHAQPRADAREQLVAVGGAERIDEPHVHEAVGGLVRDGQRESRLADARAAGHRHDAVRVDRAAHHRDVLVATDQRRERLRERVVVRELGRVALGRDAVAAFGLGAVQLAVGRGDRGPARCRRRRARPPRRRR